MASEQADRGMVSADRQAEEMLSSSEALSTASSARDRYPSNAILPDGVHDAPIKEASGVPQSALDESEMSESIGKEHFVNSPQMEDSARQAQDVIGQPQINPRQDGDSHSPGRIPESQSGSSQDRSATSAAMSTSSSSTLTSSTSSATLGCDPIHKPIQQDSDSNVHSIVPSPSSFVQKRDSVSQVPKRQRIPRACDACRRKKIRCNLSSSDSNEGVHEQACANCHQSGVTCTFTKSVTKRGPNKGYIQQLESRLAALESSVSTENSSDQPSNSLEADRSQTAHRHGQLPSASSRHAVDCSLPPQKKARLSDTLPRQRIPQDFHHPLQILPPSHPFSARTASNETWSRTTAPPTLYSANSFFLSSHPSHPPSVAGHRVYHENPHHSPPNHAADASHLYPPKSTLPPISRLISSLPKPDKHAWPQRGHQYFENRTASSSKANSYDEQQEREQNERGPVQPGYGYEHDHNKSIGNAPSRQPLHSPSNHYTDYIPPSRPNGPVRAQSQHRDHAHESRRSYHSSDNIHPTRSPSGGSPASFHQAVPEASPKSDTRLRWPATSSTSPQGSVSVLSRLDKSAVLSLDSQAFRRAVFDTPAMRTFSILPPALLEEGFQGCHHLIKAGHLLSTSSATLDRLSDTAVEQQWDCDLSAVIGECMVPMRFDNVGSNMTCREIETLMMCYVDALRRGKLIAGILGAISGKLAILETRGLPCKRYQAVGILLAVWHTVGYSSRRMYFGTPSTSGPDAIYSALDTKDPTILAICIFTYNLDKMCRRYCQNGETYVPPESIEFTRVIAASGPEPLPKAQLRLLSSLDSFLLALNFAYNQSLTSLPSIEALERQRHQLHSIVNDADSSDLLNLLVGPHVLAMASCVALYCLAACREKGESETDTDQKQNIRTLERDYLSILDALRNMTTALSAIPESSLVNSHPFADGGDMRLLYAQIANFVKINLAAAISSSKEQLSASQVIGNLHSMGYLGTILAASQESKGASV